MMCKKIFCLIFFALLLGIVCNVAIADTNEIDATSIRGKVLCGYQGWFRCPTDGFALGWHHWSSSMNTITPSTLTFEMWPDMTEYDVKYEVPGFSYPNSEQAHLYSAVDYSTVLRHFEWMENYGIDGVWFQRFLVGLNFDIGGSLGERYRAAMLQVLNNVQNAASQTGRIWALAYDMAEMPTDEILDYMTSDWKNLVDKGITDDPRYLHHNGKPVLALWEFNRLHRPNVTATVANQLIDFFKNDPDYGVFLVGGCEWTWRNVEGEWASIYRSFDTICPWNAGNTVIENGKKWANTDFWQGDIAEANEAGMLYLPVIYPGFSWDNLQNLPPGTSILPRQGGKFYWKQFHQAADLGLDMVYVAMFDEVDEGTAIYKVTNQPPEQAHFVTYEDFPSDWYLRLTAEGTKMLRGEREITPVIPIGYLDADGPVENLNTGTRYDYIQHAIFDAIEGDVIVVEPGTYVENIYFDGKNLKIKSIDPNAPDVVAVTIINGDSQDSVVTFFGNENASCELAGLTIANGQAYQGGGIYNDSGNPSITNCTFKTNSATDDGGAIFNRNGNLAIKNCVFINNSAGDAGGGIKNESASPIIANCIFTENSAVYGGGMYNRNQSNPIVVNCTFSENSTENGGGIRNFKSSPALTNCILWNNWPDQIKNRDSSPSVIYSNIQGGYSGQGNIDIDPCFVSVGSNGQNPWEPIEGMISYWKFDQRGGTTVYDFVGDNNGVINGAVWINGKVDGALSFNGSGDYVNCGNATSLNITGAITIKAWIYPTSSHWGGIVSKGDDIASHDDYALWFDNGVLEMSFNWPENWKMFSGNISIPLNAWSYVGGTWDGNKVRLYVNGELDKEFNWSEGISTSSAELYIGVNLGGGNEYFNGKIDEVAIYDIALSSEEIQQEYQDNLSEHGDYHLKSEVGRWDPNSKSWAFDDVTSPCIDAGNPLSDWTGELWPHGKWINIGAYGGTPQAGMSLSPIGNKADLNNDDAVNFRDFSYFADTWDNLDVLLRQDLDRNGWVNVIDLALFADNWLWRQ